jgi:hypothetical protein
MSECRMGNDTPPYFRSSGPKRAAQRQQSYGAHPAARILKRGGTAMRDSDGHIVPGEYNASTGQPLAGGPGKPMTPTHVWDKAWGQAGGFNSATPAAPSFNQGMEAAHPGWSAMTPSQRASVLMSMPHDQSGGTTTGEAASPFNRRGERAVQTPGAPNSGIEYDPRRDAGMTAVPERYLPPGASRGVVIDPKYRTPGMPNYGTGTGDASAVSSTPQQIVQRATTATPAPASNAVGTPRGPASPAVPSAAPTPSPTAQDYAAHANDGPLPDMESGIDKTATLRPPLPPVAAAVPPLPPAAFDPSKRPVNPFGIPRNPDAATPQNFAGDGTGPTQPIDGPLQPLGKPWQSASDYAKVPPLPPLSPLPPVAAAPMSDGSAPPIGGPPQSSNRSANGFPTPSAGVLDLTGDSAPRSYMYGTGAMGMGQSPSAMFAAATKPNRRATPLPDEDEDIA